jgi:hypothetical protein
MIRGLLALLLMLGATEAIAGRVMVVRQGTAAASDALARITYESVYPTLGMSFDVFPQAALKTEWVRTGTYPDPDGTVRQYSGVIWEGLRVAMGDIGAQPESLMLCGNSKWPTKPIIFISAQSIPSTIVLDQASCDGCSTGVKTNPGGLVRYQERMEYVASNTSRAWHSYGSSPRFQPAATQPPGVWRVLLKETASPWYDYQVQGLAVTNWDSLPGTPADTITAVVRYGPTGSTVPIIFCMGGYENNARVQGTLRRLVACLAVADSASGRQILFQTRPGPVTFTPMVGPLGATGRYTEVPTLADATHPGIFQPAGVDSDSVAVKATLTAFQAMGIRANVAVQMDSAGSSLHLRQLYWVRDLWPLAHVYPFEMSGTKATASGGNAAAPDHNYDAFGATRLRRLLPAGCSDPRNGCDCTSDTTSVLCNVLRQRAYAMALVGPDRVDGVWSVPLDDWTPTYFGRATGDIDSLVWVLWLAKIKGIAVGSMKNVNIAGGTGTGAPRGWFRNSQIRPVIDPLTHQQVGTMAFMAGREYDTEPRNVLIADNAHDHTGEFLEVLLTGNWYLHAPIYINEHEFYGRHFLFHVSAAWLGGAGTATSNWRYGYWALKGLDDWIDTVNELAGRTVIQMGYGEDTAKWMLRSGLR